MRIGNSGAVVSRVLGAVLVGGASSRFGTDKASASLGQRTMLQQQLATLAAAGVVKRVYVGGEPRPEISEARHLADMYPGEGPFGAIVTTLAEALRLSNDAQATDVIVALAVDVPLVTPSTINRLIAELVTNDAGTTNEEALTNDAAVAYGERTHWSCLAVRTAAHHALHAAFTQGERAIHRAFSSLRVARVACSETELLNVNDLSALNVITAQRDERR
ncbi:MAG: molybdenum cofactor guanylyltransferase [Ilumatobacteraceae bacterium]